MKSAEPPAGQWQPSAVHARRGLAVSYMLEPINNRLYLSCALLWEHLCVCLSLCTTAAAVSAKIGSHFFKVEFLFYIYMKQNGDPWRT